MSNEEKRKRDEYKSLRKRWIIFQVCLLGLLALVASILFVTHNNINQTYYINYTETGNIDYRVYLTDNTYFEGDYIDENYPEIEYQSIENFLEGIYTYESYEEKLSELIGPISDKYYNCYICMFVLKNSDDECTAISKLFVDRTTGKVKSSFIECCIAGYVH